MEHWRHLPSLSQSPSFNPLSPREHLPRRTHTRPDKAAHGSHRLALETPYSRLDDIMEDATAYHTLQEGTEAQNREDKTQGCETFKGVVSTPQGESAFQYILNQQTLEQILSFNEYAPPSHQIPTTYNSTTTTTRDSILPPKHSPTLAG